MSKLENYGDQGNFEDYKKMWLDRLKECKTIASIISAIELWKFEICRNAEYRSFLVTLEKGRSEKDAV
jgi:hypothetical protein